MENIPFLIARKRNQQRRKGPGWIAHLEEVTGIQPGSVQLVSAEDSIQRERRKRDLLRQGLSIGTVMRLSGLYLNDVDNIWNSTLSAYSTELVVCDMLHHPDFVFSVQASHLLGKLKYLLDFDGDTVGVTSYNLANGLIIDMYSEKEALLYEADRWGAW